MKTTSRLMMIGALVSGVACQAATMGAPADEIPSTAIDESFGDAGVRRLAHAQNTGFNSAARTVIRDQDSWRAAWTTFYARSSPVPALPAVDFARSTVVLVALGSHGTGGYDITVSRVARDAGVLYVEVTSTSPGDRCFTSQSFTEPVDIVVLPHIVDATVFVEKRTVSQC